MLEYPGGIVAFLFTDIKGSTKCWETNQQPLLEAVEHHFALLLQSIAASELLGELRSLPVSQGGAALETFRVYEGRRHKV